MPRVSSSARKRELAELRTRLAEAEETLEAIRSGHVDALVVHGPHGDQVFTLKGADQIYRVLVEAMNEGAVTLDHTGMILYCNARFADLVQRPMPSILGGAFFDHVLDDDRPAFRKFLRESRSHRHTSEIRLRAASNTILTVLLSANPLLLNDVRGICLVITDITDRKQMEVALREVSRGVLDAQELERRRVARELHDGISQLLASARHRLTGIEQMNGALSSDLRQRIVETRHVLERSIREVRLISRNLRPSELDDLGLVPALEALLDDARERTGLRIRTRFNLRSARLPEHFELTIYRTVQECLNNVERHARASQFDVRLVARARSILLRVADDGVGFDIAHRSRAGLGLLNIRERAALAGGHVSIQSAPGQGTLTTLELPLEVAPSNPD